MSGDLETPSRLQLDATFMTTGNFPNQQYSELESERPRDRSDLVCGNLAGSHEFKVGVQYSGTEYPGANCYTGTEGGACSPGSVGLRL